MINFYTPSLGALKCVFTVELNLYSLKYLDFFINFAFNINRALFLISEAYDKKFTAMFGRRCLYYRYSPDSPAENN